MIHRDRQKHTTPVIIQSLCSSSELSSIHIAMLWSDCSNADIVMVMLRTVNVCFTIVSLLKPNKEPCFNVFQGAMHSFGLVSSSS